MNTRQLLLCLVEYTGVSKIKGTFRSISSSNVEGTFIHYRISHNPNTPHDNLQQPVQRVVHVDMWIYRTCTHMFGTMDRFQPDLPVCGGVRYCTLYCTHVDEPC